MGKFVLNFNAKLPVPKIDGELFFNNELCMIKFFEKFSCSDLVLWSFHLLGDQYRFETNTSDYRCSKRINEIKKLCEVFDEVYGLSNGILIKCFSCSASTLIDLVNYLKIDGEEFSEWEGEDEHADTYYRDFSNWNMGKQTRRQFFSRKIN